MKKYGLLLCLVAVLAVLCACSCDHQWQEAHCAAPKTCTLCGKTQGDALVHNWQAALCESPKTCALCGKTKGEALGHDWAEATCVELRTCRQCGQTEGTYTAHRFAGVTCTDPGKCEVCGEPGTQLLDHDLTEATCMSLATCRACGLRTGYLGDHVFELADGVALGACQLCGYSISEGFLPHDLFFGNTCAPLIGTWKATWMAGGEAVGLKKADASIQIRAEVTVTFTNYGKFTMTVAFDKASYLEALAAYNAAGDANEQPLPDNELTKTHTGTYYWYKEELCGFAGEDAVLLGTMRTGVEAEFTVDTDTMGQLTFVRQNQ